MSRILVWIREPKYRMDRTTAQPSPLLLEGQHIESETTQTCSWGPGGGGVLLTIHGGGVPPGSPNPDPISDENMPFFIPVFSVLASKIHTRFQT